MTRTCNQCGTEKPLEEFQPMKRYAGGRLPRCRACVRAYKRERDTRPQVREAQRTIEGVCRRCGAAFRGRPGAVCCSRACSVALAVEKRYESRVRGVAAGPDPDTLAIPLPDGRAALISAEDAERVAGLTWTPLRNGYVTTRVSGRLLYLHRLIIGAGDGEIVDHQNRDRLDCRRSNLRVVTASGNNQNQGVRACSSTGVRNVYPCSTTGRFAVRVQVDGKAHWIGRFDSLAEAEQAAIAARKRLMPFCAENLANA